MEEFYVIYGWQYANSYPDNPFLIEDMWIEGVHDDEVEAQNYAAKLSNVHESEGGDIRYAVSGPHARNIQSLF
jgi:hypothetical protein